MLYESMEEGLLEQGKPEAAWESCGGGEPGEKNLRGVVDEEESASLRRMLL